MTGKKTSDRRAFLKKAALTTTVAGGTLASVEPAAAATKTLKINGYSKGGDYLIVVDDPTVKKKSSAESSDEISTDDSNAFIDGSVDPYEKDAYEIEGRITELNLTGTASIYLETSNTSPSGDLVVEGSDSAYNITVTDSMTGGSNLESDDEVKNGDTASGNLGWSDKDTYQAAGAIKSVDVNCSDGNSVDVKYL